MGKGLTRDRERTLCKPRDGPNVSYRASPGRAERYRVWPSPPRKAPFTVSPATPSGRLRCGQRQVEHAKSENPQGRLQVPAVHPRLLRDDTKRSHDMRSLGRFGSRGQGRPDGPRPDAIGDRAAVGSHRRDRQEGCDRATRVPHRKIERDREVREDPERQHHDRKGQKANTRRSSRYVRVRAQTGPFYRRSTSPASPLAPSSRAAPKTNDVVEHHAERLALLCGGARLARPRGLAPTRGGMPND